MNSRPASQGTPATSVAGVPWRPLLTGTSRDRALRVIDGLAALECLPQRPLLPDVAGDRAAGPLVALGASGHRADLLALPVERGDQPAAHEPRRAGHQDPHGRRVSSRR